MNNFLIICLEENFQQMVVTAQKMIRAQPPTTEIIGNWVGIFFFLMVLKGPKLAN